MDPSAAPRNKNYGLFVITTIVCFLALTFVLVLLVQYVYFILCNVTMWERSLTFKITYLRPYSPHTLPFYRGIARNIELVFCHGNKLIDWQLPDPSRVQYNRFHKLFQNRFWSCC